MGGALFDDERGVVVVAPSYFVEQRIWHIRSSAAQPQPPVLGRGAGLGLGPGLGPAAGLAPGLGLYVGFGPPAATFAVALADADALAVAVGSGAALNFN